MRFCQVRYLLVVTVLTFFSATVCPATDQKPNIVVLIADDLGVGDLGFSGAPDIPTPHLDKLAAEGIVFRHGYVFPMCAPTRAAFLTGRNPARIGFEDNRPGDTRHSGLDLSLKTVADLLKNSGYSTGLIGKWHVGRGLNHEYSPWNRGFQDFFGYYGAFGTYVNPVLTRPPGVEKPIQGYSTEIFADAACDFIQLHKDKPFFLNVAFNAAHLKQVARPEDLEKFAHIKDPKRRTAAAIISNLDENIGRIAVRLKELGLDQNTLLFFFSDNGGEPPILGTFNGPYRGMKFDLYEGGIRVPFFVRWTTGLPERRQFDAPVTVMDLLPTICAAAGAKPPKGLDGVNLLPYLRGEKSRNPHDALFWRTTEHAALQRMRNQPKDAPPVYIPHLAAVREDQWKLIVFDDAGKQPRMELYDVIKDPGERNNLADEELKLVRNLSKKLDRWRKTLRPQVASPAKL
jgi:arylsulfatase A-like enzyme